MLSLQPTIALKYGTPKRADLLQPNGHEARRTTERRPEAHILFGCEDIFIAEVWANAFIMDISLGMRGGSEAGPGRVPLPGREHISAGDMRREREDVADISGF
jgi:hypothetical protein